MSPKLLPVARENEIFAMVRARSARRIEKGRINAEKRGKAMSKQILVDAVKKAGMTSSAANEAIEAIVAAIGRELKKNQRFSLAGFGSFAVSRRSARMGRNPRTGEPIKIKASKGVRFKAGTKLRAVL
jgi:DNA-binding protein HU-beta